MSRLPLGLLVVTTALLSPGTRDNTAQSADVVALLQRQTQELLDAVAEGNRLPWMQYLDERMVYAAEDGSIKSRSRLVQEISPLPPQISGKLRVTRFRAVLHGTTAVTTYIAEEDEGYFGQTIHARYLSTDTWIKTPAGWRLVATAVQALRGDPPAIALPPGKLEEYVGVYALTDDVTYTIRRNAGGLVGQRTGRKEEPLKIELPDCLFVPGQPRIRKVFQRDTTGRIVGFVDRRETWDITWRRR